MDEYIQYSVLPVPVFHREWVGKWVNVSVTGVVEGEVFVPRWAGGMGWEVTKKDQTQKITDYRDRVRLATSIMWDVLPTCIQAWKRGTSLTTSGYKRTEVYNLSNLKTHYEPWSMWIYIHTRVHTYILPVCDNEGITYMYVHTRICIYLECSFEYLGTLPGRYLPTVQYVYARFACTYLR